MCMGKLTSTDRKGCAGTRGCVRPVRSVRVTVCLRWGRIDRVKERKQRDEREQGVRDKSDGTKREKERFIDQGSGSILLTITMTM